MGNQTDRGQPVPVTPVPVPTRRVLLVDDNADAVSALSLLLEMMGHEVRVAYDGVAALELAAGFRPEAVILDIGLPRMDGYAVARAMRASESTAGALLIALTGYGQPGDRTKSHDAGFDLHFVKPVSFDQIENAIAGCGARGTPGTPH